jgi:gamma-glutamyltranspeptidase/glutathione hydrolase
MRGVIPRTLLLTGLIPLFAFGCQPGHEGGQTAVAESAPAALVTGEGTQRSTAGMVVSANAMASRVGAEVLQAGGNAVDAAIATGFALAVVHPTAGNIGGGGFMVIRFPDGRATAMNFREKAPLAAHPEMFMDESGEYSSEIHHNSHRSVGVPGTVAGFALAHQRYGSGDWKRLVDPAAGLAAEGFALSEALAGSFNRVVRSMEAYPASLAKFTKDGEPFSPGDLWVQSDLARTLERIRDMGRDGFYTGETARLIAQEMERGGGMITEEDLARYEAQEVTPVQGTYNGYEVISMAPPSSGGTALVEMLNILEGFDLRPMGHNSAPYVHHLTEAMRRAFRDRARYLADADFADPPIETLTSKAYAEVLRTEVDPNQASVSTPEDVDLPPESEQTTHFSVVDADGMAVSVTYTLEAGYGSKIVVPGGGFLLNNEMGDFNAGPGLTTVDGLIGTEPNLARPEQRMLSSMTPTILAKDGELVAVIGSPGGRTIINTVLQVALNIMEFGMSIQEAVDASRFHHQWLPDRIRIEEAGVSPETLEALSSMGHEAAMRGRQGSCHAIMIDPDTGERIGAPDPRDSDGGAAGY